MIDWILAHKALIAGAWTLGAFFTWCLCAIAGRADEESEKMGRIRRVR